MRQRRRVRAAEALKRKLNWIEANLPETINRERARCDDPPPVALRVFQYTSLVALRDMLALPGDPVPRELYATAAPYMNDSREFDHGREVFLHTLDSIVLPKGDKARKFARSLIESIARQTDGRQVFCACFSAKHDDLGQWRGYGDNGRGCSIGFDRMELTSSYNGLAGWVVYESESQTSVVKQLLSSLIETLAPHLASSAQSDCVPIVVQSLERMLPSFFPFFKDAAFREEEEFRIIYTPRAYSTPLPTRFHLQGHRLKPYVVLSLTSSQGPQQLPLREVCLAPGSKDDLTAAAVKTMLSERNLRHVEITRSSIPFIPHA